ncbi:glycosyltransferase [Nocardioides sp. J2M5]|uniref:glycosyltransferase family 2 protein n=1 Tax=Nocardioides palaemonis TaxID=2829810 RepID=UPI001BAC863E|nr:glycosyltransferase [Nocardioides palaemonis]MBS2936453.1 glycosyltransferase [Nocardioides palaemonis]
MTTGPRVSIVVPVFDTDPGYLSEALASALAQTVPVDVVLVDDCSTSPATVAALEEIAATTSARLLRHEVNRGPGLALNTGIEALDTDYVFAMGSDDRVEPTYAALATEVLDERDDVSIVTTDIQCFGASDAVDSASGAPNGLVDMLFYNVVPGISVFRRRDWVEVGGFGDLRWFEDYDFWLRVLALGGVTVTLDAIQYHYRIHAAQATATTTWEDKLAQQLEIVRRNPDVWAAHLDVVMERLWRQQVELNYFTKRYGRINDVKKQAIDLVLALRARLRGHVRRG